MSDVKCCDHWEKRKSICQKNDIYQPGAWVILPTKVTPDIDFTDELVVQCDIPTAKQYVGDFK